MAKNYNLRILRHNLNNCLYLCKVYSFAQIFIKSKDISPSLIKMYSRPKPGETEEDLLRLQAEFDRQKSENKIKPAATAVSNKAQSNDGQKTESSFETTKNEIEEQLANTFEAIPNEMQIKNIVEKHSEEFKETQLTYQKSTGFPKAKRRDLTITSGKGSIFAQQIKRMKKDVSDQTQAVPMDIDSKIKMKEESENKITVSVDEKLPSRSYILTGSESKQIHEENLNLIRNMSEDQIKEERENLIATMDPAIIAYLKSKRKKEVLQNRNPTIREQNEAAADVIVEELETPAEILAKPRAEKWLNFDVVETNKLAWMKNVDIPKLKKAEKFEARFDFEGWVLPYSEPEINEKNRILYHHGEEPGRPGYTLQELFQLSRSSVMQQKTLAINTIANILALYSTGVYDDILDLPLEQIFFVIRFCLDDNTPAVLNASIKAMRNLVFSQVDEVCLDSLLGFGLGCVQPTLAVDNEMEDDNTVNDQQLAEKNLVKCLARTEILTRIRYIINTVRPAIETIVYCMDILIRLSRDSDFIVNKILLSDGLLDSIVKHSLPVVLNPDSSYSAARLPLLQAIKLFRVLSSRNRNIAIKLMNKYKIMDSVLTNLSNDSFSVNVNGLRLQTECMYYWSLLLHYGLAMDYFSVLQPILLNLLDYHFKNTDFHPKTTFVRHSHVAALLILLRRVIQQNYSLIVPFMSLLLEQCFPKWASQFSTLKEYPCGKLQVLAALILSLSSLRSYQQNAILDEAMTRVIESEGFSNITTKIRSGSMLLNNYETHKTSTNIKSLESAAWHTMDHVVPIIQSNSCLPFLYSFSEYVKISTNKKLKLNFLKHKNLQLFLTSLQKLEKYYLTNNWFARPESMILINILKISVAVKDDVDTSLFYELAVKCLSVFNSEQKPDIEYLFSNIIFSPKFYPSEILMQNLDISQRTANLETSLENLGEIMTVYSQVLGLKNNVPDFSTCCLDIGIGNVIPVDWIYTPILILYSNQLQNKANVDEEQQIFTIRNCLRWILIYETYFPFLASTINPTDKFCRLACVFLGSDSLFLTKEIHDLLEMCFRNVITKSEKELDFKKEIQGLSNFQDFYTQLLEQYQGVSYGDVLFANIILVPLAQKHNIQYRKTLWSEYMGVVQIFNVTPEQCICDLNLFLNPPEEDMSLLKCYRRAIVQNIVRKHSVLFRIANYHVEKFVERRKPK